MKVLVARLDSVGDVLLSGPAVRGIAQDSSEVWMLCGPQGAAAGELLPGVDRVLTWAAPWIVDPPPELTHESARDLLTRVGEFAPDAAVILTSYHQSPLPLALLLRLAGVPHITGASIDYAGSLLDVRLKPGEDFPEDQPEALRAITIAEAAGFPRPDDDRLQVDLDDPVPLLKRLAPHASYVVVHPGAAVPARQWPHRNYRALVDEMSGRGYDVVVTGTPAEAELTAYVAGRTAVDLGGQTTLAELARVLACADVVITGNTGPAHLAAAVGAKVVSLFSPVVPAIRWAPWRVPSVILGDQHAPCRGTRARDCPVPGHPCLASVHPAEVIAACEELARAEPDTNAMTTETEGALR